MSFRVFSIIVSLCLLSSQLVAKPAPGGPGAAPRWASARKVQVGTSINPESKVWFTSSEGVLSELYYPTIDQGQLRDAQLLVSDGHSFLVEERTQTKQRVEILSPSLVKVINRDYEDRFEITHTYYAAEGSPTIIDEVEIRSFHDQLSFYLLVNSHLNNSGMHDSAYIGSDAFLFTENATKLLVAASVGFESQSVGFVGVNDGWTDLNRNYRITFPYQSAVNGNVAGVGKLALPAEAGVYKVFITYHFGDELPSELDLQQEKERYQQGWQAYLGTLRKPATLRNAQERLLYERSLYTLRVHEDKSYRGAFVASLSIPWGEQRGDADNSHAMGGYHLVWPRDLYHIAMALLYAGDPESAYRALQYLKMIQYTSKDGAWHFNERVIPRQGAFPQNTWVNGVAYWQGFQIDQTGYPVHLFYHLYQLSSAKEKQRLLAEFQSMLKAALTLINNYGPWTQQERWEENFGISPSSFAVAASALKIGGILFGRDEDGKAFASTAQRWLTSPGDNIDTWTYTSTGIYGDGKYYLRIAGCEGWYASWDPNNDVECNIANSSQKVPMKAILDQGFLKLALLGLKPANDPRIVSSLQKVNRYLAEQTPVGMGWHRYSFDAYGENQKGRLWPLLNGEHGRYAIALYESGTVSWLMAEARAHQMLDAMMGFANDGLMIPEQVWEKNGEGTGAATPLSWSHAEFIKLILSLAARRNIENPFWYQRPAQTSSFSWKSLAFR